VAGHFRASRRPIVPAVSGYLPSMTEILVSIACVALLVVGWFGLTTAESNSDTAAHFVGRASVIDADTLELHDQRIRILDIDAPESRQVCTRRDGAQWRCGQEAALALSDWIGQRTVDCAPTRKDRYGRWLAHCAVNGKDMGEWLSKNGWAVPYRDCKCEAVRDAADQAKARGVGVWSGEFQMPWDWRKAH
jgi:endonuclease YncB( thermonuclease family)